MNRERPVVILVMAILNFVVGGLNLLGQCIGAGSLLFLYSMKGRFTPTPRPGQPTPPDPFGMVFEMYDAVPGFFAYTIGSAILGFLLAVALIVGGVGLLKMQPWARWTCIAYSVISILGALVGLAYTITVAIPGMERWQADYFARMNVPPPPTVGTPLNYLSAFMGLIIALAYPVTLLVIMFLPTVIAAFAGRRLTPLDDDDLDDDYDRPPPRRHDDEDDA